MRLATYVAAAFLVFPAASAGADDLPEPTVRVVSGARTPSTHPATQARPSIPAPHLADNTIPVAPSPTPRLDSGLPRPEVVNTKSAYLRRLRAETPTPRVTRSNDVSAPARSSFPRSHARRNLTIPAPPPAPRHERRVPVRYAHPPAPARARSVRVDPSLTRLPAPAVRPTTPYRAAPTTGRNVHRASSRTRTPARVTRTARPSTRRSAGSPPPPPPPPAMVRTPARKPLTVPPAPAAAPEPTPIVRSLLQPVPGCADG